MAGGEMAGKSVNAVPKYEGDENAEFLNRHENFKIEVQRAHLHVAAHDPNACL